MQIESIMTQPFLPFAKPVIDEATIAAVGDVLRSGWITSGPKVQAFEAALSAYFGGRLVRTFNSGTCTMEIALRVAGIGPGDEVITTPISWVATANVILEVGATPVFADIDPVTRNIDLDRLEAAITPRTRAIIPVYLAGLPVDMDRLYDIAKRHDLRVVEDAAQAIGSCWRGRRIGAVGDLVSFSFQANKNITSAEGGCLVLNTLDEARLAEKYRPNFPASLNHAPLLVPTRNNALRGRIDTWLVQHEVRPEIVGEFEDNAMLNTFGRNGMGRLTQTAVSTQDTPVVQGVVLFGAVVFVLTNLVVDLVYPLLDPRIAVLPRKRLSPA